MESDAEKIARLEERLKGAERALELAKTEQDRRLSEQSSEHKHLERMVIAILASVATYIATRFIH